MIVAPSSRCDGLSWGRGRPEGGPVWSVFRRSWSVPPGSLEGRRLWKVTLGQGVAEYRNQIFEGW